MRRRVLVVSLNPAIDAEWRVQKVRWEEKNNVDSIRAWAGGKGVNVARWLDQLNTPAQFLVPLGGLPGRQFATELRTDGLSFVRIPIAEATRTNVMVTQEHGPQLRFNPWGPRLTGTEWQRVRERVGVESRKVEMVIFSGSLPREAPVATYARLIRLTRRPGLKCVLDCDGPAFRAGVAERPFLVKPNHFELGQWLGREVSSPRSIVAGARELSKATGGWVLVSCGPDGGYLINEGTRQGWRAQVPTVRALNAVGAGDAMLAAAVTRMDAGAPPEEWLRWGLATGTAATQCVAGKLPKVKLIRELAGRIKVVECGR